jgi:hypothetical protein
MMPKMAAATSRPDMLCERGSQGWEYRVAVSEKYREFQLDDLKNWCDEWA